jgi:hypothetical protein
LRRRPFLEKVMVIQINIPSLPWNLKIYYQSMLFPPEEVKIVQFQRGDENTKKCELNGTSALLG